MNDSFTIFLNLTLHATCHALIPYCYDSLYVKCSRYTSRTGGEIAETDTHCFPAQSLFLIHFFAVWIFTVALRHNPLLYCCH